MARELEPDEKSITWVVIAMAIVILLFGWGILANSYATAMELQNIDPDNPPMPSGRGRSALVRSLVIFTIHSFREVPRFFTVIAWNLQHRMWLFGLIALAEVATVAFGFGMKLFEGVADDPYKKLRARRESERSQNSASTPKKKKKKKRRPPE